MPGKNQTPGNSTFSNVSKNKAVWNEYHSNKRYSSKFNFGDEEEYDEMDYERSSYPADKSIKGSALNAQSDRTKNKFSSPFGNGARRIGGGPRG